MQDNERWFQLCQQATAEQDPAKLLALVKEINDILEAKEARLLEQRKNATEPPVLPKDKRGGPQGH
jgi:hypothetical protein